MSGRLNGHGRSNGAAADAAPSVPEAGLYLFIGGTLDGEMVPVANSDSPVWIPVRGTSRRDEYRPMYFRVTPQREHIVYAVAGLSADSVLERLVGAYPSATSLRQS